MLYPHIAQRAFNTPLLVEPGKAMAFLSGLGPRILGRKVEVADTVGAYDSGYAGTLPARAGILANSLTEDYHRSGDAPYAVVDRIAVIEITGAIIHRGSWIGESSGQISCEGIAAQIEAAASDPAIRGIALEIDSFGGEVAGVFDLADRIRATRKVKPVWAFVAEHAFSAGYALASQATRILLPRTGAVGSIGVLVIHADLSNRLDQEGVRVTLIHSGQHKVDGNSYAPLPETVRDDIQREIDMLRQLFAETVASGRGERLSAEAALATEAMIYRGADAVTAGLADEVSDPAQAFAEFRRQMAGMPALSLTRQKYSAISGFRNTRKDTAMSRTPGQDDVDQKVEEDQKEATMVQKPENPPAPVSAAASTPAVASSSLSPANPDQPSSSGSSPSPSEGQPTSNTLRGNLAELSAQLRQEAAEITEIAAQAARLGIAIDAVSALRDGTPPETLRRLVLERATAAADARDIVAAPPSPVLPTATESPIVAAAKRAAAGEHR